MERLRHPKVTVSPDQVADQVRRSRYFLNRARELENATESFDNLVAAIYFSRAAVEVLREGAKLNQLPITSDDWDAELTPLLPRTHLVHLLRIQDFHRTPLSGERRLNLFAKVVAAGEGSGEFIIDPDFDNPRVRFEGAPDTEAFFLLVSDKHVQTHLENEPIRIVDLIEDHNAGLDLVIPRFADLLEQNRRSSDNEDTTSHHQL